MIPSRLGLSRAGSVLFVAGILIGLGSSPLSAATLFQDNFDTNPCGRWAMYYDDWSGAGCTVYYYTAAQDACGSTWGYAYREYAGNRWMVSPSFTTAGYTNLTLTFWYKNDSGASLEAQVLRDGSWVSARTVGTASSWTQSQTSLTGTITGLRFHFVGGDGQCRRLDCVSITGDAECSPPVVITQHPSDLTIPPGQTAIFFVTATGDDLTYQWQKDGADLTDGGDISGATADVLLIANAEPADDGNYRCVVTGTCGTVTSNPATLTVTNTTTLFAETFDTDPFSSNRWRVEKDGEPRPGTVNYLTDQNACGSTNGYIERYYDGHRDVIYNGSFTTAGYEDLKLTFWYKNASGASVEAYLFRDGGWSLAATGGTAGSWTKSETTVTGTITGIYFKLIGGADQSRKLDCISIAGVPECSPAVVITQHPTALGVCPGQTAIFTVAATGSDLTYQWQRDEVDLGDGGGISGATTPTLQIVDAQPADNGDYRCVVTGTCGTKTSNAAALTVSAEPTITQQPGPKTACTGNAATFTISAVGAGTVTYQWQKDGGDLVDGGDVSGATTTTLQIANAEAADQGNYRCVVVDDCGATISDEAALTVTSECISASPGGHYVSYKGRTLLLIGDNGTQCVPQNANVDHREWIDDCAARGIRSVHVWSFVPPRQKQDGSVIESRWGYVYPGLTPWARRTSGPLAHDQLYRWNLQAFDDGPDGDFAHYWPRMRDLCSYAKSKDVIVGVTLFTGWAKHQEDWVYHPLKDENGGHLVNVGDVCIIASPGTEVWQQTWSDGWSNAKKTQWVWERMAKQFIDQLSGFGNVYFTFFDEHSYSEGNMGDHFLQFVKSRGVLWMDWNARRSSVDFVYSDTYSATDKNSRAVSGFNGSPARPYFLLEGEPYMSDGVRTSIWTFAIGGGHYHFQADSGQETVRTGIMGYDPYVPGGDKGMTKRDYLGHASRLFNDYVIVLDRLAPNNSLSDSGTYCLADPGREYVVYSMIGSSTTFNVNLSAAAGRTLDCRFYNPRTGQFNPTFQRTGGGTVSFTKPDSNDWALHLYVPMKTLWLTETNESWGDVAVSPQPLIPGVLDFPAGTAVSLTATPIEGKAFGRWTIWGDPNRFPDANYAVTDSNLVLQLTMDHDYAVQAAFKCGSGVAETLPLLAIGLAALAFIVVVRRMR